MAQLGESAARGRELAALLDPDTPAPGVTKGPLRSDMAAIAVPSTTAGQNMTCDDFALTAGWGISARATLSCPARDMRSNAPAQSRSVQPLQTR